MSENNSDRERAYIVLRLDADVPEELGTVGATTADQACRKATDRLEPTALESGVRLVAVPRRYWHPHVYRTQTDTRLVVS